MPGRDRLPIAALGFGLAAALSSWNPLSAPFGVLVGVAALLLAVRALRRAGERRALSIAAVAVSFLAVLASGLVLALTAGVGRELGGTPVVQPPTREEVSSELDRAAERTRAARERARGELERLEPQGQPAPSRDTAGSTR
jgi:predicted PurR-regulated permease PerM